MAEKFIQKIRIEIVIIALTGILLLGYLFVLPVIRERREAAQEEQMPVQEEQQEIFDIDDIE